MLLPKFATHISPFKLSHFANRGHQHFQHLRNTFTNINLSSTVGQNSHTLNNSATATGLGSSTSGSSASGGAGGAKWNAGSRTNWNQQAHSRLITQTNATSLEGFGSRLNEEDEDHDEFAPLYLSTIGIYKKRNRTISSRWSNEQTSLNPTGGLGLECTTLQTRCKTAFVDPNQANSTDPLDQILSASNDPHPYSNSSTDPHRTLFPFRKPPRRHSIDCLSPSGPNLAGSRPYARRFSTGNLAPCDLNRLNNLTDIRRTSQRNQSTLAHQSQPGPAENGPLMTSKTSDNSTTHLLRSDKLNPNHPQSIDQQWIQRATHTILTTEKNHHTTYYQLRKMLDSYLSSTSQPSSDVIDLMFWGIVVNKPNYEPITNLLDDHRYLTSNTPFKPSHETRSILLTALCRRDLSNAKELEHRKNRLANISVNQQLNQSLPNLSLAPVPTTEDVEMIGHLNSEPNFGFAAKLFDSFDREIVNQLQPAALEALIQCCANIDHFGSARSSAKLSARLALATKVFKILEDRQELSAESYSNLIVLMGLANKLPQAKALFETYKQSRSDPDEQNSTLYHQHQLKPPSSFILAAPESVPVQKWQPQPVNESSDAQVLLSLMRVYLATGDSIAAVGLLEDSLSPTLDPSSTFKSSAEHILEVILGFIRSNDYLSASNWIKRLFNGDHATYQLDDPSRRREFMDRIVTVACEPNRGFEGIGVAYDAAMISIDQIDFQFNSRDMAALMARLRNVLNLSLVHALHQFACLNSSDDQANAAIIPKIQDSLEKACSIVCCIITKRSASLKSDSEKLQAISDSQTYTTIENLAKRVIQTCLAIKNQGISKPSESLINLGRFSDDLLARLMSHYSTLPDIRNLQSVSSELRQQSSYLTGLLTSYQSILQPIPTSVPEPTYRQLLEHQFKFGLKITTPIILNNFSLVIAMQFYQFYVSTPNADQYLRSINDWAVLLTVGSILEIQAKEGKTIPSIQPDLSSSSSSSVDHQVILEPLMDRFASALKNNSDLSVDQLDETIDVQLLLRVVHHYRLKVPGDDRLQAFLNKLQNDHPNWESESVARFEHYVKEGDKYLSNRFGLLRDGLTTLAESAPVALAANPHPDGVEGLPQPYLAMSHPIENTTGSLPAHIPFQSFNKQLSQLALSMFCCKDLKQLDRFHESVRESTSEGRYLSPDGAASLVETCGRLGQVERLSEMYLHAHVALASLASQTTPEKALRSVSWTRVENQMIIGLAYCGLLEHAHNHKNRLLQYFSVPSADAYAAIIQHTQETTDDASMALKLFEEAIRNRVSPNTFLCNTIISKLSKARRSKEALEVFEFMKQSNVARNSVTFGAIINACSKTGDEVRAEELFREMLVSKSFTARIPPFNTMIQLFTQHVKQPNRQKVLYYYGLMKKYRLAPSDHTYNLLMQAYGMIEPCDPNEMERIFEQACKDPKVRISGAHWSTLLNVRGCIQKDLAGAISLFERIGREPVSENQHQPAPPPGNNQQTKEQSSSSKGGVMKLPDAVCYEALFNVFLVFKRADLLPRYLERMKDEKVHMTAYVVNTLMKVYASAGDIQKARDLFESLVDPAPGHAGLYNHPNSPHGSNGSNGTGIEMGDDRIYREPSCYETIIRIEFGAGHLQNVKALLDRLIEREYPVAIVNRIKKIVNL
ncbi:hypothetical protein PGT21_014944 [Puccinia graminis f. sp. tritici]|uniref:Pentacotripeptide-repeat region of PRORP domain-containing protein n=1 Tax=Puccinia graminis f. sp. tritici TaxID=56615 RepID=A0A5B0NFR6_PUCGR|nr:hypothetical protein PGT21_014944 [Puccinia graminis f. sp. tritici]